MEEVHTNPDIRYWSEVLCSTMMTTVPYPFSDLSDLDLKVIDLEKKIIMVKFWSKILEAKHDSEELAVLQF